MFNNTKWDSHFSSVIRFAWTYIVLMWSWKTSKFPVYQTHKIKEVQQIVVVSHMQLRGKTFRLFQVYIYICIQRYMNASMRAHVYILWYICMHLLNDHSWGEIIPESFCFTWVTIALMACSRVMWNIALNRYFIHTLTLSWGNLTDDDNRFPIRLAVWTWWLYIRTNKLIHTSKMLYLCFSVTL